MLDQSTHEEKTEVPECAAQLMSIRDRSPLSLIDCAKFVDTPQSFSS